jgi:hypothetical protein
VSHGWHAALTEGTLDRFGTGGYGYDDGCRRPGLGRGDLQPIVEDRYELLYLPGINTDILLNDLAAARLAATVSPLTLRRGIMSDRGVLIIGSDLKIATARDELIRKRVPPVLLPLPDVPDDRTGPALPLCAPGALAAGGVYPSSKGDGTAFYLPGYALRVVDGRYTTGLHYLEPGDDPTAPLARLDVELVETRPADPRPLIRMDHVVVVRLVYQALVEDRATAGGPGAGPLSVGPAPYITVELGVLTPRAPGVAGLAYPVATKPDMDRIFQAMSDPRCLAYLQLQIMASVGRRTWRQIWRDRLAALNAADLLDARHLVAANLLDVAVPIDSPDPAIPPGTGQHDGSPGIDLRGTQVEPGDRRKTVTSGLRLSPKAGAEMAAVAPFPPLMFQVDVEPLVAQPMSDALHPADPVLAEPLPEPGPGTDQMVAARWHGLQESVWLWQQLQTTIDPSDLATDEVRPVTGGGLPRPVERLPVIPLQPIITPIGLPVLVRVDESCVETVPFTFDPQVNANVFDLPDDLRPGHAHVLIRSQVDLGSGAPPVTVYQDSASLQQYYVEPQVFRLSRSDLAPHLPDLRLLFLDVVQGAGGPGGAASLDYRVQLSYRVVPTLESAALERVRQIVAPDQPDASFSMVVPTNADLTLQLPGPDGSLEAVKRPVDPATFDDGISDDLLLESASFQHLVALLGDAGLSGQVDAELRATQRTSVPLRVALTDSTGTRLLHAFRGPVGAGIYRVRVTNPLESAVRLDHLYRVPVAGGVVAFPQADPGLVIPPLAGADLDYSVTPADADIPDLEPVLGLSVLVDLAKLLPKLLVNQGYAAATFPVDVSAPTLAFGVPPTGDPRPLTGISVEFDDGTVVLLSVSAPTATVSLRMRLLPWLLNDPDAQAYGYQIRNVYGSGDSMAFGPSSAMIDGQRAAHLVVAPNPT